MSEVKTVDHNSEKTHLEFSLFFPPFFLSLSFSRSPPPSLYLSLAHTHLLSLFSLSSNVLRFMLFYVFLSLLPFFNFLLSPYPSIPLSLSPSFPPVYRSPPPSPLLNSKVSWRYYFHWYSSRILLDFHSKGSELFIHQLSLWKGSWIMKVDTVRAIDMRRYL